MTEQHGGGTFARTTSRPLILYTRHGCHLCEDFEQELRRQQQVLDFELEIRDVDSHPDWISAYHDKVPLLLAQNPGQDQEICRYFIDPQALQAYLAGHPV